MKITKRIWGMSGGKTVFLFELNSGNIRAVVSNYGGVLQSLYVPDAFGKELDIVLGYDTLAEYQASETFFGAVIGPIADRLGEGSCTLGGKTVQLPLNAGPDTMHSGPGGFHGLVWDWEILADGIRFCLDLNESHTGFPGNLKAGFSYRIPDANTLRIEYGAVCDCETALSFTNHSYFNLDGGENHCCDQLLTIRASRYAETERESDPICTGRALMVENTPFDFRQGRMLGDVLAHADFREIRTGGGVDHFFLVDGEGMREHAVIESKKSGLALSCRSDAPGILVYTGNGLAAEGGKKGKIYDKNWAICLETECFPNGVNLPEWRKQVILSAKMPYKSVTEFVFSLKSTEMNVQSMSGM